MPEEKPPENLEQYMTLHTAARFCRICHEYNKKAEQSEKYQSEDERARLITPAQGFYNLRDAATTKALAAAERQRRAFEAEGKKEGVECMRRAMHACEFCDGRKPYMANDIAELALSLS